LCAPSERSCDITLSRLKADGDESQLRPDRYAAEEDEELEFDDPVLGWFALEVAAEPAEAGAAGAAVGAAAWLVPAVSEAAGVVVLSAAPVVGFSADSLPAPGFILSE
jgi:hypothetical protein